MAPSLTKDARGMALSFDVIILGAGAAGLFCAAEAARRGHKVALIDHAAKIGEKIRISGGGRCNFTNVHTRAEHFLSENPKFCRSALSRFTPKDFIKRVDAAGITWHEKALGQLFCDGSATQIVDLLVNDCLSQGMTLRTDTAVEQVEATAQGYAVTTSRGVFEAPKLVVATGGKSIPKIGASGFGYTLATQFGLPVITPRPALVPLTFDGEVKEMASRLSGVGIEAVVAHGKTAFREGFLFTHRGLSGPSILQVSSYWREGDHITIDLLPGQDVYSQLRDMRASHGRQSLGVALATLLPKRLVQTITAEEGWEGNLADWSDKRLRGVADRLHRWTVRPAGSEGYRTAEVTLGGVDTRALNSKTMAANDHPNLFFIGEVVDVTGWLGGFNFQWAWASGYAAAHAL